ncbi:MAG: GNAT family N-acetyltransferase [Bryobacterales bacterium]|nr:GNAT family N-acetyltransferase [Bryobacterales bacterium]
MPAFALRPVTPEDGDFLLAVFRASHPEYEMLPVGEEQKRQLIGMQFQLQTSDYRARYPESRHEIIEVDGKPAGRIWVAGTDYEIRILDVGLLPEVRNRGVGTALAAPILAEARACGKPVASSVLKANAGSLRWHQRLGFRLKSEDQFYFYLECPASVD